MTVVEKLTLVGIAGSLRSASLNRALLRALQAALPARIALRIHPLDEVPLYNQEIDIDPAPIGVAALRQAIAAADGLVLASPEYNNGMSGVLKNALDWASRPYAAPCLKSKPTLVMSASPGMAGGVRSHVQIVTTLLAAGARLTPGPHVAVGSARDKFTDGALTDEPTREFMLAAVNRLAAEIVRLRAAG
ncbi:NADPH-dependent FMN reductase [Marinimicrococcus flavescens]|uniref:NAD(P)H-dependent oxidoreductase n=1 Tax=Marinimicrococcus flavescens TaxID=3031815 RepID=A0AAP3XRH5_9PROT|nr:NAD(P)H-dependent oxidoreductase [Marinimicrococcus flavescens]